MGRLEQQLAFILEIDKVKNIFRQNYLADGKRRENDAEHSWHIALMAILLQEYADEPVDVLKVMTMVLVHDLVEIDAGDTYAYDTEGARLLDNFQPLLLNDAAGGISWREHGVEKAQIYKRNEKLPETSELIWNKMREIIQENIEKGNVKESEIS